MIITNTLIVFSSLSFLAYGIAYFKSTKMKSEFKRFGLEKAGALTATLELLGSLGLIAGLMFHVILLISSAGLALLMFLGVIVRIKARDNFGATLPALFFCFLNALIFFMSVPL